MTSVVRALAAIAFILLDKRFTSDRHYGKMKAYIRMLDDLRLLMIEYLQTYKTTQSTTSPHP